MQTWPGFQPHAAWERRKSKPWAILLCIGYMVITFFELSMIRFVQGQDGRWIATKASVTNEWLAMGVLCFLLVSFIGSIGFVISSILDRRRHSFWQNGQALQSRQCVQGNDLLYVIAWLYAFQTFLLTMYSFFLPDPLFPKGSIGSIFESASLHLFILVLCFFWFRGRGAAIGLNKPKRPLLMVVVLILLFIGIAIALDAFVTTPVSDLLQLSPQSEREQGIQEEIVQAKANDWINSLTSLAVIGILVPIAEEMLYRGVIQTYLVKRWGVVLGIAASSLWFALTHFDIGLLAPLFVISLAVGCMRHYFQSVWAGILLHSLNNLASVAYYFL